MILGKKNFIFENLYCASAGQSISNNDNFYGMLRTLSRVAMGADILARLGNE
jgi:hypothetical protein